VLSSSFSRKYSDVPGAEKPPAVPLQNQPSEHSVPTLLFKEGQYPHFGRYVNFNN